MKSLCVTFFIAETEYLTMSSLKEGGFLPPHSGRKGVGHHGGRWMKQLVTSQPHSGSRDQQAESDTRLENLQACPQ